MKFTFPSGHSRILGRSARRAVRTHGPGVAQLHVGTPQERALRGRRRAEAELYPADQEDDVK